MTVVARRDDDRLAAAGRLSVSSCRPRPTVPRRYFGDRLQLQVNMCTQNSPGRHLRRVAAPPTSSRALSRRLSTTNPEVESYTMRSARRRTTTQAKQLLGQTATGRKQLETVGPEAFQVSYFVTLQDPKQFDGVVSQVAGLDGVDNVNSLRDLLGPLFSALSILRWASLGTALLLHRRGDPAGLQHDPDDGVRPSPRDRHHAPRRRVDLAHPAAVHLRVPRRRRRLGRTRVRGLAAFMHFAVYGYLRPTLGRITTWVRWQEAFTVGASITVLAILLALVPTLVMTRKYLKV
ncbi:MAG: permease-like cell division protein FtsX [Nocardioidaceae bacterium]